MFTVLLSICYFQTHSCWVSRDHLYCFQPCDKCLALVRLMSTEFKKSFGEGFLLFNVFLIFVLLRVSLFYLRVVLLFIFFIFIILFLLQFITFILLTFN